MGTTFIFQKVKTTNGLFNKKIKVDRRGVILEMMAKREKERFVRKETK